MSSFPVCVNRTAGEHKVSWSLSSDPKGSELQDKMGAGDGRVDGGEERKQALSSSIELPDWPTLYHCVHVI